MAVWKIGQISKKPKLNAPILIEGLPGIGNVGKVAVDFIIEELKAVKLYEITSYAFPHSVFINEKNIAELPSVEIYYKKYNSKKQHDLLLLAGDVQPVDEADSYEFSDNMLDIAEEFGSQHIITLGGIGLPEIPKKPRVYCTGNSKDIIAKYKDSLVINEMYGVVGPIVGVSGLMVGLATRRKLSAVSFLAETYGHPLYLGLNGAREILKILNNKLKLGINIAKMDKEIKDMESEIIKRTEELGEVARQSALKRLKGKLRHETSYIG